MVIRVSKSNYYAAIEIPEALLTVFLLLNEIGLGFSLKGTGADARRMPETAATRVAFQVSF